MEYTASDGAESTTTPIVAIPTESDVKLDLDPNSNSAIGSTEEGTIAQVAENISSSSLLPASVLAGTPSEASSDVGKLPVSSDESITKAIMDNSAEKTTDLAADDDNSSSSSDEDSSSESTSDSESSSSSSSTSFLQSILRKRPGEASGASNVFEVEAEEGHVPGRMTVRMDDFDDMELDGEGAGTTGPPRTINEVDFVEAFDLPLVVDDELQIEHLGTILHIVDDTVVVKPIVKRKALDLDSLLCLEDRRVLGRIFETFGRVDEPLYSVRISLKPIDSKQSGNSSKSKAKKGKSAKADPTKPTLPLDNNDSVTHPAPPSCVEVANNDIVASEATETDKVTATEASTTTDPSVPSKVESGDAMDANIASEIPEEPKVESIVSEPKDLQQRPGSEFFENRRRLLASLVAGMKVLFVVTESKDVVDEKVWVKGYDASDMNDEELAPEDQEFSDDEAEREHLAKEKLRRKRAREEKLKTLDTIEGTTGESAPPAKRLNPPHPASSATNSAQKPSPNPSNQTQGAAKHSSQTGQSGTDFLHINSQQHGSKLAPSNSLAPPYPYMFPPMPFGAPPLQSQMWAYPPNMMPLPGMSPFGLPAGYPSWPYAMMMPTGEGAPPMPPFMMPPLGAPNFVSPFVPPPNSHPSATHSPLTPNFVPPPPPSSGHNGADFQDGRSLKIRQSRPQSGPSGDSN